MIDEKLAKLLTGEELGIPPERLDTQGLVAAIRHYKGTNEEKQRLSLEIGLATAMLRSYDWQFLADAIYLARGLRLDHKVMVAAVVSAETKSADAPPQAQEAIRIEAEDYFRDVPSPYQRVSSRINLTRTDLRGADLSGADLTGADITGADLWGANLTGANLMEADLGEAKLDKANLTDALITEEQLVHVQSKEGAILPWGGQGESESVRVR